jgi:uncharacterized membrane protein YgdD (TMEM256/DUF423 family)
LSRFFIVMAALFGLSGVAAGALAAHMLGAAGADGRAAELMRTGSSYALWHALAMLAYLALWGRSRVPLALFTFGTLLFSFSLYALALGAPPTAAYATPVGGVLLLGGWLAVAVLALMDRYDGLPDP